MRTKSKGVPQWDHLLVILDLDTAAQIITFFDLMDKLLSRKFK